MSAIDHEEMDMRQARRIITDLRTENHLQAQQIKKLMSENVKLVDAIEDYRRVVGPIQTSLFESITA